MTVENPKPKQLLRPITTGAEGPMNQSQFLAITCNSLKTREKSCVHGAIGFGFASHWLKNWRESFKPITKRSNCNHVITFDSHLKTALKRVNLSLIATESIFAVLKAESCQTPTPPQIPTFYTLIKIHKPTPVGRPILGNLCNRTAGRLRTAE